MISTSGMDGACRRMSFAYGRADARSSPFGGCAVAGHDLCARRHVPHGLRQPLSGRGAGSPRHRRRLLHRSHAGHEPRVSQVRQRDRLRHLCGDQARRQGLSRRAAAHAQGRLAGVHAARSMRSICATGANGGISSSAPTGEGRTARARRSAASTIIRSCTSRIAMRWPTRSGPARTCRPRRSGSLPRAAGSTAPSSPGAMSSRPADARWRTPGRASFPRRSFRRHGYERTSPVDAFPPNGYGLYDMIGNVWEWTSDWYSPKHEADAPKACCIPENPRGGREDASFDPCQPQHQDSPQGDQGRLAPVRAELLPPLSPRRAPCRGGRYVDESSRVSLCSQTTPHS